MKHAVAQHREINKLTTSATAGRVEGKNAHTHHYLEFGTEQ